MSATAESLIRFLVVDTLGSPSCYDNDKSRQHLRNAMRNARSNLPSLKQQQAASQVQALCLPLLVNAKTVAGYFAINGELSINALLATCRTRGQTTVAPVIDGDTLAFLPFDENTEMMTGPFGIQHPDVSRDQWLSAEAVDVVLVPLTAFDAACNRLGMGGGYYDRSFAMRREKSGPPLLIGIAHALQQTDNVFHDWWDVPLDKVVTDQAVFERG